MEATKKEIKKKIMRKVDFLTFLPIFLLLGIILFFMVFVLNFGNPVDLTFHLYYIPLFVSMLFSLVAFFIASTHHTLLETYFGNEKTIVALEKMRLDNRSGQIVMYNQGEWKDMKMIEIGDNMFFYPITDQVFIDEQIDIALARLAERQRKGRSARSYQKWFKIVTK